MAYRMDIKEMKIAEKLVILNDRAVGMLTRIYNIKKACSDPKSKPAFMSDKQMENAIKHISRKFPVVDTRSNSSTFHYVSTIKDEIAKSLSLYYYTFADLLDLKDNIMQLLTTMNTCQYHLDIALNYELTAGYLNLVVNLICLMVLLAKIEDRKIVLGVFNAAYDLTNGQSEPVFARLGIMIVEYEVPLKKLTEDLGPFTKLISSSLISLSPVYLRRNITADTWRNAQILSLTSNPQQILYAAQTDTMACEYLSLDVMDRWIVLCCTVCHSTLLEDQVIYNLWQHALQMSLCLRLFRDEVFIVHQEIQVLFDSIKGYHKKVQEIKDYYSIALQQSVTVHHDRRRYLRSALRELALLIKDQPGLLGPKILFVWMGLSFSRDEVIWLIRHISVWPSTGKKANRQADELTDRLLPELLHWMLELRQLVNRYSSVIHTYYLQYVSSYDSIVTSDVVTNLSPGLTEYEAELLGDFAATISNINSDTDFKGLRLDWFRFQAATSMGNTSIGRSPFTLKNNKKLAVVMNTNVFHLKMIDLQEEMLRETSDLSIYCFYPKLLERQWKQCLVFPASCRYSLSFARICAHFNAALHSMCPEERSYVIEKALSSCNSVLDDVCQATTEVMGALCEYELRLTEQTSTIQAASKLFGEMMKNKGGKAAAAAAATGKELVDAGEESYRMDRMALTLPDKLQTTLVELCAAFGHNRQIVVSDHFFATREYFSQHLEYKFVDLLHVMLLEPAAAPGVQVNPRRPSEMLMTIQAYMNVLQNIDLNVSLDMARLFNNVLLQQTQPLDARSKETLTSIYTKWYLEVVLRRASTGHMIWSDHLQAMISSGGEGNTFAPEQYTDPLELRCLAQMLGPYGVKYLSERLIWHVASQIGELNKIVVTHKEYLVVGRAQFDDHNKMKEVLAVLSQEPKDKKNPSATSAADAILQRTAIIGQILCFRDALQAALRQVLLQRLPFMTSSFNNLYDSLDDLGKAEVGELGAAMGVAGPVDIALSSAVRAQNPQMDPEEHYHLSCLLLVSIAISLPKLALQPMTTYKPSIQASMNNIHCVPVAINTIAGALFHLHGKQDAQLRMKEFLALASSCSLRMAQELEGRDPNTTNQSALYIILEQIVIKCRWLSMDVLEACFPYNLIRTAYVSAYQQEVEGF